MPNSPDQIRRRRPHLGTLVEVTAPTTVALEAAFAAIARVHDLMSFQDSASELSRINASAPGDWIACDRWTAEVLERALFWTRETAGAFDPVVGRPRPSDEPFAELAAGRVRRLAPQPMDLSGIAKGYAVDRAVAAMRDAGATWGLVNAGGDLRGFGARAWPVVIVEPGERRPAIEIGACDRALATSTPQAASSWASVSVLAPTAMDADALTKAVLYAPPALARACLALVGAEALVLGAAGWTELERAA